MAKPLNVVGPGETSPSPLDGPGHQTSKTSTSKWRISRVHTFTYGWRIGSFAHSLRTRGAVQWASTRNYRWTAAHMSAQDVASGVVTTGRGNSKF